MTTPVYTWSHDWYVYIVTGKFNLRSMSQVGNRPWVGGRNVKGPHAQAWMCDVTLAPALRDPDRQKIGAFLKRLGGQAGLMRLSDASRLAPWWDRNLTPGRTKFSDGFGFTDGTGFADGYLPPNVFVATSAARGSNSVVLGGFPVSTANVITAGDMFRIKPAGIGEDVPHLYEAMFSCSSDASGKVGLEIAPRLRTAVAIGDPVSLRFPSTVFRFIDDSQGDIQMTGGGLGTGGFSLVEALDRVP